MQGDFREYIYVYIKRHKQGSDEDTMNGEKMKFSAKNNYGTKKRWGNYPITFDFLCQI